MRRSTSESFTARLRRLPCLVLSDLPGTLRAMDPVAAISATLSAIDSAQAATSRVTGPGFARRRRRHAAHAAFQESTARVIVWAEYLAVLSRVARSNQRQALGVVSLAGVAEVAGGVEETARALRPLLRITFVGALLSDLVTINAVRVDLRQLFESVTSLVSAAHGVSRIGSPKVQRPAQELMADIGRLYEALPTPDRPWRRLLSSSAAEEAAYAAAVRSAWASHRAYREVSGS